MNKKPLSVYSHQLYVINKEAMSENARIKYIAKRIKGGAVNKHIGKTDPFSIKVMQFMKDPKIKMAPLILPTKYQTYNCNLHDLREKKKNPDLHNFTVEFA